MVFRLTFFALKALISMAISQNCCIRQYLRKFFYIGWQTWIHSSPYNQQYKTSPIPIKKSDEMMS